MLVFSFPIEETGANNSLENNYKSSIPISVVWKNEHALYFYASLS